MASGARQGFSGTLKRMTTSSILIPLCATFFAVAILAGYLAPRLDGMTSDATVDPIATALAPAPVAPRAAIPQIPTPFPGQAGPGSAQVIGAETPLTGDARRFIDGRAAHIYYDPPQELNDFVFLGPDGKYKSKKDLKGRYTLLNIWATWCGYCLMEMPSLQNAKERFTGTDMNVVAISIDAAKNIDFVRTFLKMRGLGDVGLHYDYDGRVQFAFPVSVLPVTFLLDREARVVYSIGGTAEWDSPQATAFLESFVPLNQ